MNLSFVFETGEAGNRNLPVDQATFACVEAAQTSEQQEQVNYEIAALPQPPRQNKPPKEKKILKCQVCDKVFSHTGKIFNLLCELLIQ